jgi:hypothetical protein
METCGRLEEKIKRHVSLAITGYHCKIAAAPVVGGYVMEASGHMPLGCTSALARGIRATFKASLTTVYLLLME